MAREDLDRFKNEHMCFVEKINKLRKDAFMKNQLEKNENSS